MNIKKITSLLIIATSILLTACSSNKGVDKFDAVEYLKNERINTDKIKESLNENEFVFNLFEISLKADKGSKFEDIQVIKKISSTDFISLIEGLKNNSMRNESHIMNVGMYNEKLLTNLKEELTYVKSIELNIDNKESVILETENTGLELKYEISKTNDLLKVDIHYKRNILVEMKETKINEKSYIQTPKISQSEYDSNISIKEDDYIVIIKESDDLEDLVNDSNLNNYKKINIIAIKIN